MKKIKKNFNIDQLVEEFNQRGYSPAEVAEVVAEVIEGVASRGDEAVCEFTRKFDQVNLTPEELVVSREEVRSCREDAGP